MERVRTAKEEKHYFPKASNQQHLYDLRFSRHFVLVRVAYLSSSEASTYNLGVFGKQNGLGFNWWKY
jgi:hypothetical protein